MAEIIGGEFKRNDTNQNSMGGTERLTMQLAEYLNKKDLEKFQIVSSRVRELDEDKIRIFWAHDLPGDPESNFIKDANFRDRFHKYVFVSNWQMQGYMQTYNLPWSKCMVIHNAIEQIPDHAKPNTEDGINLIYHSTPHRGLNILSAVFDELTKKYDNLHLDVFSSFKLYGWESRDEQYAQVFEALDKNKYVTNHGTVDNDVIRKQLQKSHIFAYPSTWAETSCLCLMEAMSAKNVCVHPNYGALFETSANWTHMYQMQEDQNRHASVLYNMLDGCIQNMDSTLQRAESASAYANLFYNWGRAKYEWRALLQLLENTVEDTSFPKQTFSYSTN
jgi:glycosyltransferase involved in cell wall biosynthesis